MLPKVVSFVKDFIGVGGGIVHKYIDVYIQKNSDFCHVNKKKLFTKHDFCFFGNTPDFTLKK